MTSPFIVKGPAALGISGGRTSGRMLFEIIQALGGGPLPDNIYPIFADTGKEHPKTHKFLDDIERHWPVNIYRIKMPHDGYDTPYDALLARKKFLPNAARRFCTQEMKMIPTIKFMQDRGHKFFTNVVGFRYDEPVRLKKKALECSKEFESYMPLALAKITKPMVREFWNRQPFDLEVPEGCGNCQECFLKKPKLLIAIEQRAPGTLDWAVEQEKKYGGTFVTEYSMKELQNFARNQGQLLPVEDISVDCACTD